MRSVEKLDEILDSLGRIGVNKQLMHYRLGGWVNSLGLYVRMNHDWTRITAGGMWRPCIDAMFLENGTWQVRKFDEARWDRRFARLLQPTLEISEFITEFGTETGLRGEPKRVYWDAIRHFQSTGEWVGLETAQPLPQGSRDSEEQAEFNPLAFHVHNMMVPLIIRLENLAELHPGTRTSDERTRREIRDVQSELITLGVIRNAPPRWSSDRPGQALQEPYQGYRSMMLILGRSKAYERATRRLIYASWASTRPEDQFQERLLLGMLYAAALSNEARGKECRLWPAGRPTDVTPRSLGYETELVRERAIMNLAAVMEGTEDLSGKGMEEETSELDEIAKASELAMRAAETMDPEDFEELEKLLAVED